MNTLKIFDNTALKEAGLNLHAIFNLDCLPKKIRSELQSLCKDLNAYRQLILIAHGGQKLWTMIQPNLAGSDHPIDEYSTDIVTKLCKNHAEIKDYKVIYPSQSPIGLQSLGELAGWHHPSPFRVGINQQWGSWFAYRAVVLTDSDFQTTEKINDTSPCNTCEEKSCIASCPGKALEKEFSLQKCLSYRKTADSLCKDRCLARMACPIAEAHQYPLEQIQYHYGISMKMIESLNL